MIRSVVAADEAAVRAAAAAAAAAATASLKAAAEKQRLLNESNAAPPSAPATSAPIADSLNVRSSARIRAQQHTAAKMAPRPSDATLASLHHRAGQQPKSHFRKLARLQLRLVVTDPGAVFHALLRPWVASV